MRTAGLVFTALTTVVALACVETPRADAGSSAQTSATPTTDVSSPAQEIPEWKPTPRKIVRTELIAEDLPPVPALGLRTLKTARAGSFAFPEGTDELAPRAAVALGEGLALVGQVYLRRRPGRPPATWRWIGFVPEQGDATGRRLGEGSIRAAISNREGGALLAGNRGASSDSRGWFATLSADATLGDEAELDSPMATELFDLVPGRGPDERAVVLGYVDAQAWAVSLDASGAQRWQKFVSSFGYTQIRAAARLAGEPADMLAVGSRAEGFGEAWWARLPHDGGPDASPTGVEQDKLDIAGADPNQGLHALVDLGEAGFIALGTAKRNHIQDHDQLLAVGFDPSGAPAWSRVLADVRVHTIRDGEPKPGAPGVARFVLSVPVAGPEGGPNRALALLELGASADAAVVIEQIADSEGWSSAGFVAGGAGLVAYRPTPTGADWRELSLP